MRDRAASSLASIVKDEYLGEALCVDRGPSTQ